MRKIDDLRQQLLVITRLGSAAGLLNWDQEVNLPPKAHAYRGEVSAQLAGELHKLSTSKEFVKLVKELHEPENMKQLSLDDQVIVRETWRDTKKAVKLPTRFVEDSTKLTSQAFGSWGEARKKSDFSLYQPTLEKVVAMNRQAAAYLGYQASPYDALLEQYEPGLTSKKIDSLFQPLAKELSGLAAQARATTPPTLPKATYNIPSQEKLSYEIAAALGYDLEAGRIDVSPHPFTIDFHPTDVRITTRYSESDFWEALSSTIHETGHALYQQGLPVKEFGTPLGAPVSLGVHESQSRLWENFVGKSRSFVEYLHPLLVRHFDKKVIQYSSDDLYRWVNRVEPNFIRVESDEVTYNLHVVLRYEIEKALIEGELAVADIPAVWNHKVKDYLGLDVTDDARGCLQDVHWSHGDFGYFPTYTLGNLYAAQLYHKITDDIPGLEKDFSRGNFAQLLSWLRKEIHSQGRRYLPEELLERATGEPLNPRYLIDHLKTKIQA